MNGYELTSNFYNYKFDSNGRVKHTHADLYFYIIDLWNRLGQKPEFGLPTTVAMAAVGMGSYNTYKATLNDLIEFGFIKLVKDSNNQHSAKIVALSLFDEPTDKPSIKPLDKATIKASNEPTDKPTDTIIEQEIINYKQEIKRLKEESEFSKNENYAILSENEFIKSELEKAKELIKTLEENEKKGKEKSSAKKESLPKRNLSEMCRDFLNINPEKYSSVMYTEFFNYWSEQGDGKSKQRWEYEKVFNLSMRLERWQKKAIEINQNKNHGTTSQISNSRHKSNWNAEEVARDAIAIATAHLR